MKCFYHNDMDGKCAGAIVYQYYVREGNRGKGESYVFIEIAYKDDFPFDRIVKDELVVIVDFSLQKPGDFQRLYEITQNIIWIDHHKTAIERHPEFAAKLGGTRDTSKAGCQLTWEHFYPERMLPWSVKFIADYDMWKFEYSTDTKYFQLGIKAYPSGPRWAAWHMLFGDPSFSTCSGYIDAGRAINSYVNQTNANLIRNFSFETTFKGLKVIACNQGMTNSQLFDSAKSNYDLMMPFIFDGQQYTVSIYTKNPDIDCSELAKKHGGGGHKGAAGFQCRELPFPLEVTWSNGKGCDNKEFRSSIGECESDYNESGECSFYKCPNLPAGLE